jgi:Fic family protein
LTCLSNFRADRIGGINTRGIDRDQQRYVIIPTVGEKAKAFVPAPLPPRPPIDWTPELRSKFDQALLALGRLDSVSTLLPDTSLLLYMYVRKEAVVSSMIEGTRSSLSDLLLFDWTKNPACRWMMSGLGRAAASTLQVHRAMMEHPIAVSGSLVEKTRLTPATVNKALGHLEHLGIVKEITSRKRNRLFSYARYVQIMSQGTELPAE